MPVEDIRGQGVEQFSRSDALFSGLHHHLSFLDHAHELNPDRRPVSRKPKVWPVLSTAR
jgi:hypothetical protein